MLVINYRRIWEFIEKHPDSEAPLNVWYRTTRKANWRSLADIQQGYLSADLARQSGLQDSANMEEEHPYAHLVGRYVVFGISHDSYKVVTQILFKSKTVFITGVYTRNEYKDIQLKE